MVQCEIVTQRTRTDPHVLYFIWKHKTQVSFVVWDHKRPPHCIKLPDEDGNIHLRNLSVNMAQKEEDALLASKMGVQV